MPSCAGARDHVLADAHAQVLRVRRARLDGVAARAREIQAPDLDAGAIAVGGVGDHGDRVAGRDNARLGAGRHEGRKPTIVRPTPSPSSFWPFFSAMLPESGVVAVRPLKMKIVEFGVEAASAAASVSQAWSSGRRPGRVVRPGLVVDVPDQLADGDVHRQGHGRAVSVT